MKRERWMFENENVPDTKCIMVKKNCLVGVDFRNKFKMTSFTHKVSHHQQFFLPCTLSRFLFTVTVKSHFASRLFLDNNYAKTIVLFYKRLLYIRLRTFREQSVYLQFLKLLVFPGRFACKCPDTLRSRTSEHPRF